MDPTWIPPYMDPIWTPIWILYGSSMDPCKNLYGSLYGSYMDPYMDPYIGKSLNFRRTSDASSHTPCTPTFGSMPRPRASHCFTFRPLTRLHPAWAGRIMTTCKSHTDRPTRIQRKLLCSEKSKRATAFLDKSITGFSLQIDHHPCKAIHD